MATENFDAFKPHFNALARVGYFKLVPESKSSLKNKLHFAYRVVVWIIVGTYNLQHLVKVVQFRHSTDQIVNTLFILLTILNTLVKQLVFNVRSKRLDNVIDVVRGPVFAPQNAYHEEVMRVNAATMLNILRFSIGCIFTCGSLWAIYPLVNRAVGKEVFFTGYFPFDTDTTPGFEVAVAYLNIFITFQAYGNITMDCTIISFYAQTKVQLQILRYNLEHLADFSLSGKNAAVTANMRVESFVHKGLKNEEYNRILRQRLEQCVTRHWQIKWLLQETEDIFAESLQFQFLVQAWVICMTLYKIIDLNLFSAEFISMAMYLGCMLFQLFLYCYYGTQVQYESEFVNQSIYSCSWISFSPRFRRQLLFMMTTCKQSLTPRTAYVIPISLETYIAVLRASYTLLTFLDRTRH